jgi:predicted nucleotide-binding protein
MEAFLRVRREEAQQQIENQINKGKRLLCVVPQDEDEVKSFVQDYEKWHDFTCRVLKSVFTNDAEEKKFHSTKTMFLGAEPSLSPFADPNGLPHAYLRYLSNKTNHYRANIGTGLNILSTLLEAINEGLIRQEAEVMPFNSKNTYKNKVFVVHGHSFLRHEVDAFLRKHSLIPVFLDDQVNKGQTIIEKFEAYAADVGYAIVLLTPDDEGRKKIDAQDPLPLQARARQNVILELGYFIGKLSRANVVGLIKGEIETPSDYAGVMYISYDEPGAWKSKLLHELRAAGIEISEEKVA